MTSKKRPLEDHSRRSRLTEQENRVLELTVDLWAELRQLVEDDETLLQLEGHVCAIQRIVVSRTRG
ncbi:MAG: hypothetical protein ACJ72P_03855 [Nocardioides sp.]